MKKLITIKEYCKLQKITDAGARKQIVSGKVASVTLDDQTYVVVESNEADLLKASLKSAREKIKTLQAQALLYLNQSEYVEELKNKVELLEGKLDTQRDDKEKLYEKVIGQYALMLPR
jgi:hypothetical protein